MSGVAADAARTDGVYLVVPAFNEASVIADVVTGIRRRYPHVIVVDDGSRDDTASQAARAGARVLRHALNRGQGAALQTGIEYALRCGAGIVVTFDADGQHRVEDVEALVSALGTGADVAIGSRFLSLRSNVPVLRRMLLRVAALFMRFTSGVALTDAHNGLRAFRRDAASKVRITIDGMAHASEIIDIIHQHRLRVSEVPVVIHYSDYSRQKGQSGLAAFRIAFDYLMKRFFR